MTAPPPVRLPGATVHPATIPQLNALVGEAVGRGERRIIAHQNLHGLHLARVDPALRALHARAHCVHVDGMPLVHLARLLGHPLRAEQRVTYADWIGPLAEEAARRGWRVFYLGGRPEVAERGAARLRERCPGLRIGTRHGYFDARPGSAENRAVLEAVNAFRPHVLMVGMGMPRQERWILENADAVRADVILPCGACMDYVAGAVPTPPRWTGPAGVEWLFRLFAEPRRLWRRYLLEPWGLLPLFLREWAAAREGGR